IEEFFDDDDFFNEEDNVFTIDLDLFLSAVSWSKYITNNDVENFNNFLSDVLDIKKIKIKQLRNLIFLVDYCVGPGEKLNQIFSEYIGKKEKKNFFYDKPLLVPRDALDELLNEIVRRIKLKNYVELKDFILGIKSFSSDLEKFVKIKLGSEKRKITIEKHDKKVNLLVSLEYESFASFGDDKKLKIFSSDTGKELYSLNRTIKFESATDLSINNLQFVGFEGDVAYYYVWNYKGDYLKKHALFEQSVDKKYEKLLLLPGKHLFVVYREFGNCFFSLIDIETKRVLKKKLVKNYDDIINCFLSFNEKNIFVVNKYDRIGFFNIERWEFTKVFKLKNFFYDENNDSSDKIQSAFLVEDEIVIWYGPNNLETSHFKKYDTETGEMLREKTFDKRQKMPIFSLDLRDGKRVRSYADGAINIYSDLVKYYDDLSLEQFVFIKGFQNFLGKSFLDYYRFLKNTFLTDEFMQKMYESLPKKIKKVMSKKGWILKENFLATTKNDVGLIAYYSNRLSAIFKSDFGISDYSTIKRLLDEFNNIYEEKLKAGFAKRIAKKRSYQFDLVFHNNLYKKLGFLVKKNAMNLWINKIIEEFDTILEKNSKEAESIYLFILHLVKKRGEKIPEEKLNMLKEKLEKKMGLGKVNPKKRKRDPDDDQQEEERLKKKSKV
ncbi:hypothetical protein KAH94_06040, partial [bacterium]|nr:hypothetical protein [bacterium]